MGEDPAFNHTSSWPTATFDTTVNRAMTSNPRLTKQGVRDLNHYGPRPGKAEAGASKQGNTGDTKAVPLASEKGQTLPSPGDDGKREAR
jgi:hypothetical protein